MDRASSWLRPEKHEPQDLHSRLRQSADELAESRGAPVDMSAN